VYDVEEIPTHGGSLRLYVGHRGVHAGTERLAALVRREIEARLDEPRTYADFAERVRESKRALLSLLIELRRGGRQVVGYGAPGKGNTLLNYCGIGTDFLDYTVDRNPYKHGLQLPGSRIPIFDPGRIAETKPDYVLVLPWNLIDEISTQLSYIADWGGKLIVPIPTAQIREAAAG
jgi:C-methyltransferase C-terminal domain